MNKVYLLLFCFSFFILSCTPEQLLERRENRLIGSWVFEDASFKEDGDIFRDNVFDEFRGDIITFFPNYSAVYEDASLNANFDGDWIMYVDRNTYDGENDTEFFLDMTFYDYVNNEEFSYFTSVTRVSNDRLTLIAHGKAGYYKFRLDRIK